MVFKKVKLQSSVVCLLMLMLCSSFGMTQVLPSLIINNVNTQFSDVSLPYWLNAGQSINLGTNAKSVSIVEFTVNGTNLEFSQAIVLTTAQTVPTNKVWKIEAIGLNPVNTSLPSSNLIGGSSGSSVTSVPTLFQSPKKFETPGTYNWTVPPGVNSICIEAWGGGGGGGFHWSWEAQVPGGGGGGYAYQCFSVTPGTTFTIVVGAGGSPATETLSATSGGTSSVSGLITVSGGIGGTAGGQGGGSTSTFSITGNSGIIGKGGNGANGGNGGSETSSANSNGAIPGGGGSSTNNTLTAGSGSGGRGQVYIFW